MSMFDREILALMREVTEKAILPHYQSLTPDQIEDKGGNDPVTVADRASEEMLREGLEKLGPGLAFVGEEGAHADPAVLEGLSGSCWIVDPIDGTRNFAAGQAPFGILIARAEGGLAQEGWIFDCLTGRFCAAHRDGGAFIDGERISARGTGETPPVAAISLVYLDRDRRERMRAHIAPHYRLTDIPYCAAEQYPRLALGTNDVSIFERTLAWDHAAGALWLEEAGGCARRPNGDAYRVDEVGRKGLIGAASPALFHDLARRLETLDGARSD